MMMMVIKHFLTYTTARSAIIKDWKIGFLYRFIQLIIISYIVGYELIYSKGYQALDTG